MHSLLFSSGRRILKTKVVSTHLSCWLYSFLPNFEKSNSFHSCHTLLPYCSLTILWLHGCFMAWVFVEVHPVILAGFVTRVARRVAKPLWYPIFLYKIKSFFLSQRKYMVQSNHTNGLHLSLIRGNQNLFCGTEFSKIHIFYA